MATRAEVHTQYEKFVRELPTLMSSHPGRWVVFLDTPRKFFDDEWDALEWASKNLGDQAPFVISLVEPRREVLLTAALAFGGR